MPDQTDRYFDERIETLPPDQLRKLQDHRLRWQFRRCWDESAWYRARFEAAGLSPETFGGLASLERLPLISDDDLAGIDTAAWMVAPRQWVDRQISQPFPSLRCVTQGDIIHEGERQGRANWAQVKWSHGSSWPPDIDWDRLPRSMWPNALTSDRRVRTTVLNIGGVGMLLAHECAEKAGRHWADDHLLAEIIAPQTGKSLAGGTVGELVVTDLVREANPLVRYRTGLRRILTHETCACGRTSSLIWTADQFQKASQP